MIVWEYVLAGSLLLAAIAVLDWVLDGKAWEDQRSDNSPAGAHRPERLRDRAWHVDLTGRSDLAGRHHLSDSFDSGRFTGSLA